MAYAIDNPRIVRQNREMSFSDIQNQSVTKDKGISILRKGIWAYFILLIFEGALRKWVFPNLATPFLVIRDPIAIWLLVMSLKHGVFRVNFYIAGMWIIGSIAFVTAIFWGHGNLPVALF